jgi:hypothetical protein
VKFVDRFPNAFPFQEVLEALFRNVEDAPCACCGTPTPFLDYTFEPRAKPICSEKCLIGITERKAGVPLGKPDDYRQIESGE